MNNCTASGILQFPPATKNCSPHRRVASGQAAVCNPGKINV